MAVAFFDMDKTLLAVNSGTLWVRREVALGHISRRQAVRAAYWLARYQLGFASAESMLTEAVATTRGTPEATLRERTREFYQLEVSGQYRPGGLEALRAHRASGDRLVLLTSSSNYLAELCAKHLELDGVCCTTLEVDAQRMHTGGVSGRVCFGEGKLEHARREAQRAGVSLSMCAFYTDSYSDLPVLEAVGRPVVVNPDVRLRRQARKRGWPVQDWGVPPEGGVARKAPERT